MTLATECSHAQMRGDRSKTISMQALFIARSAPIRAIQTFFAHRCRYLFIAWSSICLVSDRSYQNTHRPAANLSASGGSPEHRPNMGRKEIMWRIPPALCKGASASPSATILLIGVVILTPFSARAQSNRLTGTWRLNLEKSRYRPAGLTPKSDLWKIEAVEGGIHVVSDGVDAQGHVIHTEYTAEFDGKDYPMKITIDGRPKPLLDGTTVSWQKIGEHTYEYTARFIGQVLGTTHIAISSDGKTITTSLSGFVLGQNVNATAVWYKQERNGMS